MSETTEYIVESFQDTKELAKKLADGLSGGECIELRGDLGSGKTTFTAGLANGLECIDEVSSPSFTLKNIYHGRLILNHFDFYRLEGNDELIRQELSDELGDPKTVTVVEWPQNVNLVLPDNRIIVSFLSISENKRKITITSPEAGK